MNVSGRPTRTLWPSADGTAIEIIDQTRLPHAFVTARLATLDDAAHAIRAMLVRGAPLIGATAAWGLWLALRADASDAASPTPTPRSSPPARPPSISAGRWTACAPTSHPSPRAHARPRRASSPSTSAMKTSPSTAVSRSPACHSSGPSPHAKRPANASTCSRIATPAGSPPSTSAPRPPSLRRP